MHLDSKIDFEITPGQRHYSDCVSTRLGYSLILHMLCVFLHAMPLLCDLKEINGISNHSLRYALNAKSLRFMIFILIWEKTQTKNMI